MSFKFELFKNILYSIVFVAIPICCHAQESKSPTESRLKNGIRNMLDLLFNNYDSTYVERNPRNFRVSFVNSNWLDTYTFTNETALVELRSDLSVNFGISVGYKRLQLGYVINMNKVLFGREKKRTEMSFILATNPVSLEVQYFKNSGQTIITRFKNDTTSLDLDIPFNGLKSVNFGLDLYYFVNNKRFSNSAAYTNSYVYQQRKSTGSIITGISFLHQLFAFNFSETQTNMQFNLYDYFTNSYVKYYTFNIVAGYGYNFAIKKNWLINLSLVPSFGIKSETTNAVETNFNIRNKVRIALAYNLSRFYAGINCQFHSNLDFAKGNRYFNSLGVFNTVVGYRF